MKANVLYVLTTLIAFVAAFAVFIRFNPVDSAAYHRQIEFNGTYQTANSYGVQIPGGEAPMMAFEQIALIIARSPRTSPLAGDPTQGHVSFITRSRVWGFPDVTNLWLDGDQLFLHGQAVFGNSDLGVNRARLSGWAQALTHAR